MGGWMSQVAVLDVDIYKSSLLKESMKEGPGSPEEPGPVGAYHQAVDELAKAYAGKVWLHSGDGVIALFLPAVHQERRADVPAVDARLERRKAPDRRRHRRRAGRGLCVGVAEPVQRLPAAHLDRGRQRQGDAGGGATAQGPRARRCGGLG